MRFYFIFGLVVTGLLGATGFICALAGVFKLWSIAVKVIAGVRNMRKYEVDENE